MTRRHKKRLRRQRDESRLLNQLNEIPRSLLPLDLIPGDMRAEIERLEAAGARFTVFELVGHVDAHLISAPLLLVPHAGHMPTRPEIRAAFNKLRAMARQGKA